MNQELLFYIATPIIGTLFGWLASRKLIASLKRSDIGTFRKRLLISAIRALAFGPNLVVAGDGAMILPSYLAIAIQSHYRLETMVIPLVIFILMTMVFTIGGYMWIAIIPKR